MSKEHNTTLFKDALSRLDQSFPYSRIDEEALEKLKYPEEPKNQMEAATLRHTVTFYCHAPNANKVSLVGTFNGWNPEADHMNRNSKGEWCVVLDLLPGDYEYQAVVDGRWLSEPVYTIPQAQPDRLGGESSVLSERTAVGMDRESQRTIFRGEMS